MKIKIKNHNYLGDFELDFTMNNGDIASTVIFAGENGSGKTQVLNIIKELIANTNPTGTYGGIISCDMDFQIIHNGVIYFICLTKTPENGFSIQYLDESRNNTREEIMAEIKAISSHTEINFMPTHIDAIRNNDIDDPKNSWKVFETQNDLATMIKQLILDINNRDNADHVTWENENLGVHRPPEEFLKKKRMNRFNTAFSYMFEDKLKFCKIDGVDVLFEKNGKKFSIDNLSSGEKQIVFRGGNMIQNLNLFKDCTVLIDEPELSIHPKWQEKLLGFYKKLFNDGNADSQIFIATHSDHVLKDALEDKDTLIIRMETKNNNSIIIEKIFKNGSGKILPRITLGEVKWRVFDIPTIDFHCALFGYLQGINIKDHTGNTTQLSLDKGGNPRPRSVNELDSIFEFLKAPVVPKQYKNNHIYSTQKGDKTLCAYLRNQIDHPESQDREFEINIADLRKSINFMVSICLLQ
jgi:Uncharacterized conserved protein